MKRHAMLAVIVVPTLFAIHIALKPDAHDCRRQTSPDGRYIAERCLLRWRPGGNSDYRGRVFEASSGGLLAERRFSTPLPHLSWSEREVSFSRGGDESSVVTLPPDFADRIKTLLP